MNAPKYEFSSYLAVLECQTVQPTSDSLSSTQARLALRSQTPKGNLTAIAWTWGVHTGRTRPRGGKTGFGPSRSAAHTEYEQNASSANLHDWV